ncbi:hypothetical protein RCL_jg1795.t1 [Rhizophagus clarus]|uniref:Uncharacterized protein n=1 Tax=Rhizophagus clarus TaxID=94130 RepID=A0A8H3L757_9GLOM|nr:hypothetical protein RCL_jg1795.t1 [Rhizophagus clarus]
MSRHIELTPDSCSRECKDFCIIKVQSQSNIYILISITTFEEGIVLFQVASSTSETDISVMKRDTNSQ